MLKYYGLTFLPWITLAVVADIDDRAGAAAGLAVALAVLVLQRRSGQPWGAQILECSTAVYMAALTAFAVSAPDAGILKYGAALAIGWLAVTAWGGLAIGRPFTEGIARRDVTAEVAATGLFRSIVTVIAVVWATGFTLTAIALACVQHWAPHQTALLIAVKVAGFAVPAVFTARYPEAARKRHFAEHGIDEAAYEQAR
ncbi:hypothetical protein [Actinomadura macrotermitis]|uniref:Uncharacterized protein n=1 Tax=Actinomadura macrotermitis TaxID=2585200 RepID=A0A7K0C005_9ACTN|nr:hypothetical protein [Actinomadura macrotermitis]MQY06785.1 hypothetical protein [Actinomadura macrotermitis]